MSASMGSSIIQSRSWHEYSGSNEPEQWSVESLMLTLFMSLRWRHNEHNGVSDHQPHDWLLNHLFRRRSQKTSKLRVTGLCEGNSPVAGEFPTQSASNMENDFIWWCHNVGSTVKHHVEKSVFLLTHWIYWSLAQSHRYVQYVLCRMCTWLYYAPCFVLVIKSF